MEVLSGRCCRENLGEMTRSRDNSRGLAILEEKKRDTIPRRGPGRSFIVCFVFEIREIRIYLNGREVELIVRK